MLKNSPTVAQTADPPVAESSGRAAGAADPSLVSLLGSSRAAIVRLLHRQGEVGVAGLASHLGVSQVAARRHLAVLEDDGLVACREVADGPGRPAKQYRLTGRAEALFPQRYASMATELLDFITDSQGRDGLRSYLKWRLDRQTDDLGDRVTADDLDTRVEQLADALSDAGFDATVTVQDDRYVLRQDHCAIYEIAKVHPQVCAFETATFSRVLGREASISRRATKATGGSACECHITLRDARGSEPGGGTPDASASTGRATASTRSSTRPPASTPPPSQGTRGATS